MSHLLREHAPVSELNWSQIDGEAKYQPDENKHPAQRRYDKDRSYIELMPQIQVLDFKPVPRLEPAANENNE